MIYVLKLIINLPNYVTRYPEGVARVLVQSYPRLLREKNDEGVASKFFFLLFSLTSKWDEIQVSWFFFLFYLASMSDEI